jgi:diadenosine tetraphosphate (Ap4A) HIT family hydrolase
MKASATNGKCELCSGLGGKLLWQDKSCRVVLVEDVDYPGFCRVITNQHVREMTDLPAPDRHHLMEIVFAVESSIRDVLAPTKINLASLGNLTPHLHWHVIPRYSLDKNFPQPIWSAPLRTGEIVPPSEWKSRLARSLDGFLSGKIGPPIP